MNPADLLEALDEPQALAAVAPGWAESQAAMPPDGLPFLESDAVRHGRDLAGFGADVDPTLLRVAARVQADPALRRLAWHCVWRLLDASEPSSFGDWPELGSVLGEDHGVFYLLVGLAGVPRVERHHRALGIPLGVTRETCQQARCFSLNYRAASNGRLGLPRQQLYWLRHYTREPYFRLGRLEYWLRPYPGGVHVYRHRHRGQTLALAERGARFDAEGYLPRVADVPDPATLWEAPYILGDGTVTGVPITPWGRALRQIHTLPLSEWEGVLTQGDSCLQVHIPAGGGLSPAACADSLHRAVEFFARHFPQEPARAIVCGSWIYNPDLERFLPGDANLVRHLRELYLYPIPSGGSDGLWFVFLQDPFDPATAPRQTSVQRAILDFLAQGHGWRCGGMFLLLDHVRHYGTQHYRAQWPVAGLGIPPEPPLGQVHPVEGTPWSDSPTASDSWP
ncbi:MAG: acyltransferase domain-containing protein [Candidatus Latescibacterota bacterium]